MFVPTPPPGPSYSRPDCPFSAGSMVTNPLFFVGRKELLNSFTMLMTGAQPTSINLVGPRRIGKSSLLYHFFQTWEQRVQDTSRYVVIYLSLQDADCRSRAGFYQAVIGELSKRPAVRRRRKLAEILNNRVNDDAAFADVIEQWQQQQVLPVLCLDEFEVWLKYPAEFTDGFYDHLRSLTDKNALMFVIAAHKPIDVYREGYKLTSNFFNNGRVLYLEEMLEQEANDLVQLPASTIPGATPALSVEDQRLARQWGGRHPYLLQLAASNLCWARQQGKEVKWARERFEIEKDRLFEPATTVPNLWPPVRWLLWSLPLHLGSLSKQVGEKSDSLKKWGIGVLIVIAALVLLGLGGAKILLFFQWLLKVLGFGG